MEEHGGQRVASGSRPFPLATVTLPFVLRAAIYATKEPHGVCPPGDGFSRKFSNGANGVRLEGTGELCAIVGRVSMDQITVLLPREVSVCSLLNPSALVYFQPVSAVRVFSPTARNGPTHAYCLQKGRVLFREQVWFYSFASVL